MYKLKITVIHMYLAKTLRENLLECIHSGKKQGQNKVMQCYASKEESSRVLIIHSVLYRRSGILC